MGNKRAVLLARAFLPYIIYLIVMVLITMLLPLFTSGAQQAGIVPGLIGQAIMIPVLILALRRENRLRTAFLCKDGSVMYNILLPAAAGLMIGAAATFAAQAADILRDEAFLQAQDAYRQDIFLTAVSSIILAPLTEELLFREMMYRRLENIVGVWAAVIISSIFFALGHASIMQAVYGFIMGVLFAYAYHKRGSVLPPMVMHLSANLVTIIISL